MSTTLDRRLTDIRRRLRQVLVTYGMSWLAAVILGSIVSVCVADWMVHFDDPVVRLIFLLAIAAGAVYIARRYLLGPLKVNLSDTDLALRIEDRYPGFQDSLASSVQFMQSGGDPRIGSPALQKSVVEKTLDRLDRLDCGDVVDTREVRRIAAIALAVCLVTTLLAGLNIKLSAIALRRLVFPFSAPAWPRATNLQLLDGNLMTLDFDADRPLSIARGDSLKIFAENTSGHLPSRVTLEYRLADQKTVAEVMRPTTVSDAQGERREVAVGQLLAVRGDLEFRAIGGDDDQMPWRRLLVIPPPVVEKLQVTLIPPAYSHRPAERLPEGVGHVQGLVGTRVEIVAVASKVVEKAILRVKDQERFQVKIADDGRRLNCSFVIHDSGIHAWWLALKDAEGFEDAEPPRYEIRGLQDFEPEISIVQPASDMQVTADAIVAVRTVARDDLGIKEIRLVYKVEPAETDEEQVFSLFTAGAEQPLTQTAEYEWKLGPLALAGGAKIVFRTEAIDEFDLSSEFAPEKAPPLHVGRSVTRTLNIVSSAEKSQEIAQRQEGLLDDLERAFKLEQQAHDQVGDLLVQIRNADTFRSEDVDTLKRTEIGQREVAAQLSNPAAGLEKRARDLVEELRYNQIDEPQTERRLQRITEELDRLNHEHLGPIEQALTQARKLVQSKSDSRVRNDSRLSQTDAGQTPGEPPAAGETLGQPAQEKPADRPDEALRQVSENQAAVLESLGEMLQDLSQWRGEHDAARELSDIVQRQVELNERANELAKNTLTKPADALSHQEQADLAKIAERQKKQAEQLEQIETRMRATADSLAKENPSAAATLQEAVEQSQQGAIAGEMRDAAGQIGENRMGQAARTQQEILKKLHDLEDTIRQKGESDTEMLVKKLKQAQTELQVLHDRQADLLQKVEKAEQNDDPAERQKQLEELAQEQKKLREDTARMGRRLARLEAKKPQTSAERAASRMQQAQDELDQGEQTAAAEQQQEAIDDLEQAQRELAREQHDQEEQLAREQLSRVADELQGIIPRQSAAIDEARRLDALHSQAGKWSRGQLVSLRDLTTAQRNLAEETDRIIEKLSAAEVFVMALRGAARNMRQATERLAQRDAGAETQKAQEAARQRAIDLVDALKPDERDPGENDPQHDQAAGGSGGQPDAPQTDGISALAQVKVLITLQKELFARTVAIEKLRNQDGRLPAAAHDELEAIVREQGNLADLARNLSAISSPADNENGESTNVNDDGKPNSE